MTLGEPRQLQLAKRLALFSWVPCACSRGVCKALPNPILDSCRLEEEMDWCASPPIHSPPLLRKCAKRGGLEQWRPSSALPVMLHHPFPIQGMGGFNRGWHTTN